MSYWVALPGPCVVAGTPPTWRQPCPRGPLPRLQRPSRPYNIVYPSVRHPAGAAVAAFWPDMAGIPVPGRHLCYRWDGRRMDAWLVYGGADWRPR